MNKTEPILTEELSHLKYALKAKDKFLTNAAHELRAPLNYIIGFSEVLSTGDYGTLNDKQKAYVGLILEGGHRLLSLINNIVDMSKMDALKTELAISKFSLKSLIQDILTLLKEPAFKKNVTISVADTDVDEIAADPRKLKQVIYNLLSNSLKFTPEGGSIRIAARQTGSGTEIEVSDTGDGIAPEDLEKVFEAFAQIGTPKPGQPRGGGLSLAISKKIIEMHGGKIRAESKGLTQGSSFKFTLPPYGPKRVGEHGDRTS